MSGRPRIHAVHPRVCGERDRRLAASVSCSGSSPRVRGTREPTGSRLATPRFIPACAGNARLLKGGCSRASVHPRVCGERSQPWSCPASPAGSSPRVRGTPAWTMCIRCTWRFIPACAGNAAWWPASGRFEAVHPRVCGERAGAQWGGTMSIGSSPRVRGTPPLDHPLPVGKRFIPACAGNAQKLHNWV